MNIAYTNSQGFSFFYDAKVQLEQIINELQSKNCRDKEHGDIEKYMGVVPLLRRSKITSSV